MNCLGVVATEQGVVRLIEVPVIDPQEDEVQVKMVKSAISPGTERAFILGLDNAKPQYPYIPGYCCAGYVIKTGRKITRFKEGDRVACYAVEMGHREIGNVKDYNVVPVPSDISFRVAAFTSLGQPFEGSTSKSFNYS